MELFTNKKGFTLIELVMVIVILGILASVAVPKFTDLSTQAKQAAEQGVVGGVRSGIVLEFATRAVDPNVPDTYPSALDDVAAPQTSSITYPFFDSVLDQGGITDGNWSKPTSGNNNLYQGPAGNQYTYDNTTGIFR